MVVIGNEGLQRSDAVKNLARKGSCVAWCNIEVTNTKLEGGSGWCDRRGPRALPKNRCSHDVLSKPTALPTQPPRLLRRRARDRTHAHPFPPSSLLPGRQSLSHPLTQSDVAGMRFAARNQAAYSAKRPSRTAVRTWSRNCP